MICETPAVIRGRTGRPKKLKVSKIDTGELPKDRESLLKMAEELREVIAFNQQKIEEAKSADPFWFFEPSDGSVTEKGYELISKYLKPDDMPNGKLDSQIEALCSTAAIKGVSGGNQSGKSTTGAIKTFIQATGELPESLKGIYPESELPKKFPQLIRVVGVDFRQLYSTVIPTYQKWVPRKYLTKGSWDASFSAQHNVLTLTNGSMVEFMTNQQDPESFQGPPRDMVVYDEEPLEAIHKENLLRFTTSSKLNFMFCWTPTKGLTWSTNLFGDDKDDKGNDVKLFKLCSVTNKKANLDVLDKILSQLPDYNEIKMRLLGEFVSLSGLVYGRLFNEKEHVIPPFKLDWYNHLILRGCDPHMVKPSACLELAVDREGNKYVVGSYLEEKDTAEIKKDLAERVKNRGYRLGWTAFDKSCDSTITILGDRNVFLEMTRGENAIPAAFKSEKFTGSIHAGVDDIKKDLKLDEKTKKPKLFIFDIPENKQLITAMKFMERDTYANEDDKGMKDKIKEGKWDLHACLRYIYQRTVRWTPPQESAPEPVEERYI